MKLVSRGDTTVVDAYLSPILRRYVDQVAREIGNTRTRLMFMQSNGGLTDARQVPGQGQHPVRPGRRHRRRGGDGAAGRLRPHHRLRHGRHLDRRVALERRLRAHLRAQVAGVRVRAPMMQIHTVAAGGGSILHFDGARFRVGPDSAGANPGPASYRRGGPLDRDRLQRHARAGSTRISSRASSGATPTRRSTATSSRRSSTRWLRRSPQRPASAYRRRKRPRAS